MRRTSIGTRRTALRLRVGTMTAHVVAAGVIRRSSWPNIVSTSSPVLQPVWPFTSPMSRSSPRLAMTSAHEPVSSISRQPFATPSS